MIGHRGAVGVAPENTISSFEKAIEYGVDMVELDVHVCRTGELVVIHDKTVNRTTSGRGQVKAMSLAQLQSLTIDEVEHVPTLSQVLTHIHRRVMVNIELKGHGTALATGRLIHEYVTKHGWRYDDFLVSAFELGQLIILKAHYPKIRRAVLLKRPIRHLVEVIAEVEPVAINLNFEKLKPGFLKQVHQAGLQLIVWTIKDPADAERMKEMGVDGVISDVPHLPL